MEHDKSKEIQQALANIKLVGKESEDKHFLKLIYEDQQYEQFIKVKLIKISQKSYQFRELIDILQKFKFITWAQRSYYTKKGKSGKIKNLNAILKVLKDQDKVIDFFSKVAQYILEMSQKQINPVPIFMKGIQKQHTFKKSQILLVICMMAVFLIPVQKYHKDIKLQPRFSREKDFSYMFSTEKYKTQCVIRYITDELHRINDARKLNEANQIKEQNLTIRRIVVKKELEQLLNDKNSSQGKMSKIEIQDDKKSIQDFYGYLKADFANKFIGGGALTAGCVQQQIMFANRPQLYISQLINQVMETNESIVFIGFKKYFINNGYGLTLNYGGSQDIEKLYNKKLDHLNRAQQYIVGIDAIHYPQNSIIDQFKPEMIDRQLIKAYTGFSFKNYGAQLQILPLVTGNWGCGVFNGKHQLKLLIQWIAASMNQTNMIYCPFGYKSTVDDPKIFNALSQKSPKQVYKIVIKAAQKVKDSNCNFYNFVHQILQEEPKL